MLKVPFHIRLTSIAFLVTFVFASMWILDTLLINDVPEPQIIEDID
ncbi:hypothetical protein [Rhizobium sp. BE258]|nr:hypothetical protein [Rhizobium sp. BE258]MDR7145163.1 hypothetical protein [Rhizobium sp. BE258]